MLELSRYDSYDDRRNPKILVDPQDISAVTEDYQGRWSPGTLIILKNGKEFRVTNDIDTIKRMLNNEV